MDGKDIILLLTWCVDPKFQNYINSYFYKHPELKNQILFIGQLNIRADLYNWYSKAKIFILTSRSEGYCLSYAEASRFKNIILSTNVGGLNDIFRNSTTFEFEQENQIELAKRIQYLIDSYDSIDKKFIDPDNIAYSNLIKKIIN